MWTLNFKRCLFFLLFFSVFWWGSLSLAIDIGEIEEGESSEHDIALWEDWSGQWNEEEELAPEEEDGNEGNDEGEPWATPDESVDCLGLAQMEGGGKGDIVQISEVFAGNSQYAPFVEVELNDHLEGKFDAIILSGTSLTTPVRFPITSSFTKNTRVILTKSSQHFVVSNAITISYHSDFSLLWPGKTLEVFGEIWQSRQLLDIVKIGELLSWKSLYHRGQNAWACREMDQVDAFTPWFGEELLVYLNDMIKTEFIEISTWCTSSDDGSPSDPHNEPEDIKDWTGIQIVWLQYVSPEFITLKSRLPFAVDFGKKKYFLQVVNKTTKNYLSGVLIAGQEMTFSTHNIFADAWGCVRVWSGEEVISNERCRPETVTGDTSGSTSGEEESLELEGWILIDSIQYKAPEVITLQSHLPFAVDFEKKKYFLQVLNTSTAKSTKRYLSGVLLSGETMSFSTHNAFPDAWGCVSVWFWEQKLDEKCYVEASTPPFIWGATSTTMDIIDVSRYRLKILAIDYDPVGSDTNNETITLLNEGSESVDLSTLKLSINWTIKSLSGIIPPGEQITLKKTFWFPNTTKDGKAVVVRLVSWNVIFATFSYQPHTPSTWSDTDSLSMSWTNVLSGIYAGFVRNILKLEYDPAGSDTNREVVVLQVQQIGTSSMEDSAMCREGLSWINFADFSLEIGPWEGVSTGTTKHKTLKEIWFLPFDERFSVEGVQLFSLTGNRQMPNSKASCVRLQLGSITLTETCYTPRGWLSWSAISGTLLWTLNFPGTVKFVSVLPNPKGADSGKEEIVLRWNIACDTVSSGVSACEPFSLEGTTGTPSFSLLINGKTKKKLTGTLIPNQDVVLKGSFGLPNTASCIDVLYWSSVLDTFCYGKAKEGVKFWRTTTAVQRISPEELTVVKGIKLVKVDDQLCITYQKVQFWCKKIPNSTTKKQTTLLSFQNAFLSELENFLRKEYSLLFYESELQELFAYYTQTKREINAWNYEVKTLNPSFSLEYQQTAEEYLSTFLKTFLMKHWWNGERGK